MLASGAFSFIESQLNFLINEPCIYSYRFAHISRTLKALQGSTKTSLRIDDEGLLSLQFLMPSPKPRGGIVEAFIEFRVCLAFLGDLNICADIADSVWL